MKNFSKGKIAALITLVAVLICAAIASVAVAFSVPSNTYDSIENEQANAEEMAKDHDLIRYGGGSNTIYVGETAFFIGRKTTLDSPQTSFEHSKNYKSHGGPITSSDNGVASVDRIHNGMYFSEKVCLTGNCSHGWYTNDSYIIANLIQITGHRAGKVTIKGYWVKYSSAADWAESGNGYGNGYGCDTDWAKKIGEITVTKRPKTIGIDGPTAVVYNEQNKPTYRGTNLESDESISWSVTNGTGSATIDSEGRLTCTKEGTVTIKASLNSNKNNAPVAEKTVTVYRPNITNDSTNFPNTLTLQWAGNHKTNSDTCTWTPSDTSIATVSGNTLTPQKPGKVTVTLRVTSGTYNGAVVSKEITINKGNLNIGEKEGQVRIVGAQIPATYTKEFKLVDLPNDIGNIEVSWSVSSSGVWNHVEQVKTTNDNKNRIYSITFKGKARTNTSPHLGVTAHIKGSSNYNNVSTKENVFRVIPLPTIEPDSIAAGVPTTLDWSAGEWKDRWPPYDDKEEWSLQNGTGVATLNGTTITGTKAGTVNVGLKILTGAYNGVTISEPITVERAPLNASISVDSESMEWTDTKKLTLIGNAEDGAVTWTYDNNVDGSGGGINLTKNSNNEVTITATHVGKVKVTANVASTFSYTGGKAEITITINKKNLSAPTITSSDNVTFEQKLKLTGTNPNPESESRQTWRVEDIAGSQAHATIDSNNYLIPTSAGDNKVRVWLTIPATTNCEETKTYKDITINRASLSPQITSSNTVVYHKTLTLACSGNKGNGAESWDMVSVAGNTGGASITGNVLTGTRYGTVRVRLHIAETLNYKASDTVTQDITVGKAELSVSITSLSTTYGEADMPLTFKYNEGSEHDEDNARSITWEIVEGGGTGQASLTGTGKDTKLHIIMAGTVKIKLTLGATTNYNKKEVEATITISKKDRPAPTISLESETVMMGSTLELSWSGENTENGTVTWTVTPDKGTPGNATVTGLVLTPSKVGKVQLTITISATVDYAEITSEPVTITIIKATTEKPEITSADSTTYGVNLPLTWEGANPGNGTVTWIIINGTGEADLAKDGSTLVPVKVGTVTVQLKIAATENYEGAESTVQTVTIKKADRATPTITSAAEFGSDTSLELTYTATADETRTVSWTISSGDTLADISNGKLVPKTRNSVGEVKVKLTINESTNYNAVSVEQTIKIVYFHEYNWNQTVQKSLDNKNQQTYEVKLENWTADDSGSFGSGVGFTENGGLLVPAGANIILDLKDNTLNRNLSSKTAIDDGSVITVQGTLAVQDTSTNKLGAITGGKTTGNGGGILVDGGTLSLTSGGIKNNEAANGGGVYVSGGTFTLSANGIISDNTASGNGGGINVNGTTFTMTGGTVTGNTAKNGGGVRIESGNATISGGTVSANTATDGGGVWFNNNCNITLSNGTISGNVASGNGGGVWSNGTLNMAGGNINNLNTAKLGGGVYVNGGTFAMSNGTISGNKATTNGGGVYFTTSAKYEVSGQATVSGNKLEKTTGGSTSTVADGTAVETSDNNVYLASGQKITVTGAMSGSIYVSGNGVITSGFGATNGSTANYTALFHTDDTTKSIAYINNEICISTSIVKPVLQDANGNTIEFVSYSTTTQTIKLSSVEHIEVTLSDAAIEAGWKISGNEITIKAASPVEDYPIKVKPEEGYCWSDTFTSDEIILSFRIARASFTISITSAKSVALADKTLTLTWAGGNPGNGTVTWTLATTPHAKLETKTTTTGTTTYLNLLSAGKVEVTLSIAATANYNAATATATIEIVSNTPKPTFPSLDDGNGNYEVTYSPDAQSISISSVNNISLVLPTTATYKDMPADWTRMVTDIYIPGGTPVGKYIITATLSDSTATWPDGTKDAYEITINIIPATISATISSVSSYIKGSGEKTLRHTCTISPITATWTLKEEADKTKATLTEDGKFTPIARGAVTVVLTIDAGTNYNKLMLEKKFTINEQISFPKLSTNTLQFSTSGQEVYITGGSTLDYIMSHVTVSLPDANSWMYEVLEVDGVKQYKITVPPHATVGSYEISLTPEEYFCWVGGVTGARTLNLTISKTSTTPTITSANFVVLGDTLKLIFDGNAGNGDVTWHIKDGVGTGKASINGNVLTGEGIGWIVIELIIGETDNYAGATVEQTVYIKERVEVPEPVDRSLMSLKLDK